MNLRVHFILIVGLQIACSNASDKKVDSKAGVIEAKQGSETEATVQGTKGASNNVTNDDCIFDRSTQTDEFIREVPEFGNYTWNDSSKTASILLQNGDTLYAQRGGCHHFGISGKLI